MISSESSDDEFDRWESMFEEQRIEAELANFHEAVCFLPLSMTCEQMQVSASHPLHLRMVYLATLMNGSK